MSDENTVISKINLEYLTNKSKSDNQPNATTISKHKKDAKFYRKRIYDLTKQMLNKDDMPSNYPSDIKKSFQQYITSCIEYFKLLDTTDILQENYADLVLEESQEPIQPRKINDTVMLRSIKMTEPNSLEKLVTIKRTIPNTPPPPLPIQRDINLKDPILKNKGIRKKKNIINNYEENNEKNETNKKT